MVQRARPLNHLRITTRLVCSLTSPLFAPIFLARVLTVSASNMHPCPAHTHRGLFADGDNDGDNRPPSGRRAIVVEKRRKRRIEERHPRF